MVDYALSHNRIIGMIQKKENNNFFNIGCLGKITNFTETENGRYQINLKGLNRFSFKKIVKSDFKFITIDAEIIKKNKKIINKHSNNKKLLSSFSKFLKIKELNFNISEFERLDVPNLAKIICVISPLDYLTKQMLLEFDNDSDLYENLLTVLEIEMQNSEKSRKFN